MKELFRTLWSSVLLALIIIGIGGLSWSAFQENGWVERSLDIVWDAQVRHPLLLVPTIGGVLLMVSIYLRGGLAPGKSTVFPTLMTYGMMICGVYYSYKWFLA